MTEPLLFQGPFFDHLMTQAPLAGTRYFSHGSFSLLFEDDTRLFRLTRDGGGHVFLVKESAAGNPHVVKVLKDYGPVAPSDEDRQIGFYYWLAEVERLQELPAEDERTLRLEQALDLMEYDSADLAEQIEEASKAFPEFQSLCLNLFCCVPRKEWDFETRLREMFGASSVTVRCVVRPYMPLPEAENRTLSISTVGSRVG